MLATDIKASIVFFGNVAMAVIGLLWHEILAFLMSIYDSLWQGSYSKIHSARSIWIRVPKNGIIEDKAPL